MAAVAERGSAPVLGITQWFPFEERAQVEQAVEALKELGVREFRTTFSWADWERPGGTEWFDWFVGKLTEVPDLKLLPCLFYTPPHLARKDADGAQKTSYPPEDLSAYAGFVRQMIERYGEHFEWMQLWNEANWDVYWSWTMDPHGDLFAPMAVEAADVMHELGKKVFLGGTTPLDYPWFGRMAEKGLLARCDAIGFHYSPSWPDNHRKWQPFDTELRTLRALLKGLGEECEIWLSEVGVSTRESDEKDEKTCEQEQITYFKEVHKLPVDRVYWYCLFDFPPDALTDDEINGTRDSDPIANHFGIVTHGGKKKPLYDYWKEHYQN